MSASVISVSINAAVVQSSQNGRTF